MFERTRQFKSESSATTQPKGKPIRFDRQDRTNGTGPIAQDATLAPKELRIVIQQCFNPLHHSASGTLSFGEIRNENFALHIAVNQLTVKHN